jgi:hypothetical protein
MALFQGGCEFPLLRERFWRLAAAGMPAEPDRRMSNGTPSPGSRTRQQQHPATSSALPPTPPQPEHRSTSSQPRKSLRSAGSLSVDLGSLQQRRQEGNSDYLPPAFGGHELHRSESEAPARKGRFGLRSLDLQVSDFSAHHTSHSCRGVARQQRILKACPCEPRAVLYCNAGRSNENRSG